MTCSDLIRVLDLYLDDEMSILEMLQVQEHLHGCNRCRALVESEGVLHALLAADAIQDGTPTMLRERILRRVTGPAVGPATPAFAGKALTSTRTLLAGAGLVVILVVALTIPTLRGRSDVPPFAAEVAAKHRLYTQAPAPTLDVMTPDVTQVTGWLHSRLGYPIHAPRPVAPGERIVGGRVSSLANASAAYLLYEWGEHRVSLFVMPPQPGARPEGAERIVEGVELYTTTLHGLSVLWWEDAERLYVAASTAGLADLEAFAVRCVRSGLLDDTIDSDR